MSLKIKEAKLMFVEDGREKSRLLTSYTVNREAMKKQYVFQTANGTLSNQNQLSKAHKW